jgi:cytochrome c oxidase subunit 4
MILLFITVWAAYMHIPVALLSIGLALTIAIVKATMVVLYFMHVKFQTRLTWLWAALGFIWLFLLFGVMMDYISRTWDPVSPGWTTTTFPGGGDPKPAPAAEPAKH